ncbi:MAG TPA: MerR family transcriptional regulator [Planctomycetes bacterium]|nr:MerR family transcriptional regulator [Planctomycetota bacterium]
MALRTGEVARRAGVNVETLRFYERRGILPEPPRGTSGYRQYPPETVDVVRFVKRAQQLGFSLRQARELLDLRQVSRQASRQVRTMVQKKLSEIEHKIRDLQAMRQALSELLCACEKSGSAAACPIIESLNGCPVRQADEQRQENNLANQKPRISEMPGF